MNGTRRYLVKFAQDLVNFRLCEIDSLVKEYCKTSKWVEFDPLVPFAIIESKNISELYQLVNRSMLIRSLYELWECAPTSTQLRQQLEKNPNIQEQIYCGKDRSFRIQVESFNRKIPTSLKVEKIEQLDFLDFEGEIKLTSPDNSFHLIEFYGADSRKPTIEPERVYFGRWLCDGNRRMIDQMRLSERKFISNTSMDVTLSLIMANLAQVKANDLVLDPFVGSGSLLVAAAKFGAYVMGCDIDYLLLHGLTRPSKKGKKARDPDESIQANLAQYKLEHRYIDVMVADSSRSFWHDGCCFDAIITDPPYGIRESSIRVGQKESKKVPKECLKIHIPSKVSYSLGDINHDLLKFADARLKINGRLVYWLPVNKMEYNEDDIPKHSNFKLLYHAEQRICRKSLRVLICMEKVGSAQTAVSANGCERAV